MGRGPQEANPVRYVSEEDGFEEPDASTAEKRPEPFNTTGGNSAKGMGSSRHVQLARANLAIGWPR